MIRLAVLLLLTFTTWGVHAQDAIPAPPQLSAKAYILMDAATGTVLAALEADLSVQGAQAPGY